MNHTQLIDMCWSQEATATGADLATVAECVLAGMAAHADPDSAASVARGTCLNGMIAQEVVASVLTRNGCDMGAAAAHMAAAVDRTLRLIADDPMIAESTDTYRAHLRALIKKNLTPPRAGTPTGARKDSMKDYTIKITGNTVTVTERATGKTLAEYNSAEPKRHASLLRRYIDAHLATGGTLGNYQW